MPHQLMRSQELIGLTRRYDQSTHENTAGSKSEESNPAAFFFLAGTSLLSAQIFQSMVTWIMCTRAHFVIQQTSTVAHNGIVKYLTMAAYTNPHHGSFLCPFTVNGVERDTQSHPYN